MDHRSPLDNIFNIIGALPNGHDKPVKHAFYNALAIFLLCLCSGAVYALHFILEPFLKPLIWALLVGSVLHPLKNRLAQSFQSWLTIQEEQGTPVLLGIAATPLKFINNLSEFIGSKLLKHLKIIIAIVVLIPLAHLIYYYTPKLALCAIWKVIYYSAKLVTFVTGNITLTVISSILLLYTSVMLLCWKPANNKLFHYAAVSIWLMISCYVANMMGSLQIPVLILLSSILMGGFVLEIHSVREDYRKYGQELTLIESLQYGLSGTKPSLDESIESSKDEEKQEYEELINEDGSGDKDKTSSTKEYVDKKMPLKDEKENEPKEKPSDIFTTVRSPPKVQRSFSQPHVSQNRPITSLLPIKTRSELRMSLSQLQTINPDANASYYYMYTLMWACGIMIFWKNIYLLPLLPIPILLYVIKHVGSYLGIWNWIAYRISGVHKRFTNWIYDRYDALVPVPIRGLIKAIGKMDKYIHSNLKSSVDTIASSVVIFGLIIFVLCASIFILVQVYSETIMLVQMTSNVINQTVVHNPELRQLLPPTFDETVDSVLDNAYQYGRDGISKVVRGMLSEVDAAKSEKLEKQVLELWDRIYQTWMTSGNTNGPTVTVDAVQTSWNAFLDDIQKSPEIFNINGIATFAKQNLGTLMSLLESVWAIVKGNISLVLGSFSAFVSVLLGGGTAVLNFILNVIIFLTTLFYLLSSSGNYYKPVEMMTKFSANGSRFMLALEDAVNGVFTASFKMCVFHGMWTWFIHNLFGMNIVYLPSAFASILGAAPFLGTYWACIPAVLDLWFAQGQPLMALIFFIFQFAPTSVVDTAIYAEIKGGGHPYLTGLAIAGGIFCLGLEGAIIGPLVLCGLYVVMDLSTTLFKESPSQETLNLQQLSR